MAIKWVVQVKDDGIKVSSEYVQPKGDTLYIIGGSGDAPLHLLDAVQAVKLAEALQKAAGQLEKQDKTKWEVT